MMCGLDQGINGRVNFCNKNSPLHNFRPRPEYTAVSEDLTKTVVAVAEAQSMNMRAEIEAAGLTLRKRVTNASNLLNYSREMRDFFTPTEGAFAGCKYPAVLVECEGVQLYEAFYIAVRFRQYCERE